jgi:hypothetical membrane protein
MADKKNKIAIIFLGAASGLMLLLMFVLPWFSFPGYSITRNDIWELGAQFSPHAWIINISIVLLSAGSILAGWSYFDGFIFHRILLVIFGISFLLTAVFNHSPVNTAISYNLVEAGLHTYFAATAVLSFTIMSIATSFIPERQKERLSALASGVTVLILSVLSSESEPFAGLWQRLMFLILSGWMIIQFNSNTN